MTDDKLEETQKEQNMQGEVKTEVTSIAKEEEKTGEKIPIPDPETLFSRANASFINHFNTFVSLLPKLSAKQKIRVITAVLSLPEDGVPVLLKTDIEKYAYAMGQRAKLDQFTIFQYHIHKEASKAREKKKSTENLAKEAISNLNLGVTNETKEDESKS